MSEASLPSRARVVIIGGGIIGCSVAYHLTKLGLHDVVLLEQGRLSCGTTWHAAGLVGQLRASESGTRLVQYSAQLYAELFAETGLSTGYKQCGGVTVARTPQRLEHLRRTAATAQAYDLDCELITAQRAGELYPLLRTDDLLGALWLPGDGTANPTDTTNALARGARMRGASIHQGVRVVGIDVSEPEVSDAGARRVRGVRTDQGDIEAEIVVNCAGQWANAVAAMAGVNVPLHSAEHFYVVTDQIDGVHPGLPVLRDPDGYTYVKEEVGGLVVGGFEPQAKAWVGPHELPYPFEFQLLGEDWEHFEVLMDSALHRLPVLHETGIRKFYNGPESFTPDNQFILGEAPQVRNLFVGAGFNSVGIASAGGAGRALAEWILAGEPTSDLSAVDIRRFAGFQGNTTWLRERVVEILGLHYEVPWPNREPLSARDVRRSPVHERLAAAGAVFGTKMGWERANVFMPGTSWRAPQLTYTWDKPDWLTHSIAEQQATRQRVALFDQTSFGKIAITGPDAEMLLQRLCTADLSVGVGAIVYTGMLNQRGGYEADVTITRTGPHEFMLVTGAASIERDQDWITRHIQAGERVQVRDISSQLAVFALMGPRSRELLSELSHADLSDEGFGFATSRPIDLARFSVRASRITYVGELGWELYVPVEAASSVHELLVATGTRYGLAHGGYYAINALRLELGYRAWAAELTPDDNPVQAGLQFTCKLGTDLDFIGRAAVERARAQGVGRRLVSVVLTDPEVMPWGGELVLRDGVAVGQLRSAAWGSTVGAGIGLAYLRDAASPVVDREFLTSGEYQVNVGGRLTGARISLRAPVPSAHTTARG